MNQFFLEYVEPDGKRKQNIVSLGEFPSMGLKQARTETETRKTLAKNENVNLVTAKRDERLEKAQTTQTFQEVADGWLDLKCKEWTSTM